MPDQLLRSTAQAAEGPLVLDGETLIGIIVKETYTFSAAHEFASEVTAFEVEPASEESRLTGTASVILDDAEVAWLVLVSGTTAVDLSDVTDRGGIVWVRPGDTDADRQIVGFAADPGDADATYLPTWPDGLYAELIEPVDTTGGGGGGTDVTTTITDAPAYFDPDTAVETWEGYADAAGVSSTTRDSVSLSLSTTLGALGRVLDDQADVNANSALLALVGLITAAGTQDLAAEVDAKVGPADPTGTGLFSGLSDLVALSFQTEGILDRKVRVAAVEDVANLDVATLTAGPVAVQPTFAHGSLAGISTGQRPYALVLLLAQTDPDENRIYKVDKSTGQWSLPADTDIFWPPGNDYRAALNAPGDPEHGMAWEWSFDDPTVFQRGGNYADLALSVTDGRWTLSIDPTASGGSTDVAAATHALTGKTTPVDADEMLLVDSAASNVGKKLTWANLKATLKTYFDTLYVGVNDESRPRVVTASGTSVTSSTTLVDATGLGFPVVSGKRYTIDGVLFATGTDTGDIKIACTHPGGTMAVQFTGHLISVSAAGTIPAQQQAPLDTSGTAQNWGLTTTGTVGIPFRGSFTASSSGTFQVQFAQRVSDATATQILSSSYLTYRVA